MFRAAAIAMFVTLPALGQTAINRAEYADRLRAMWLGQCIANWTGLRTEGQRIVPPFFTDADWGTTPPGLNQPIEFVLNQNPWRADDDTDIEYVYLHLMHLHQRPDLTPPQIAAGWLAHMDPAWIWVSNRRAWDLMVRGVRPPATGMGVANEFSQFIDAQLTTEFYGALAPGMPDRALALADLPIRTTADTFAAHASQFYAVLYSIAPHLSLTLTGRQKAIWLVQQARAWIPGTSKTADIVDFVLADFLANPDPDNWELTRDRIAERYMLNAAANGFWYLGWPESSVNFACGVMALLYGQFDYKRTVQIGTLSGWDSDNGTATMGGLIGLCLGYQGMLAQFPGQPLSDRYAIEPTRNNMPDYLPADPQAEDTFTLMAQRMMPIIDLAVAQAGGSISPGGKLWMLPHPPLAHPLNLNPLRIDRLRSANHTVRDAGGQVTATSSAAASPWGPPWTYGAAAPWYFANGYETDDRGLDQQTGNRYFYSTQGAGQAPGTVQTFTVEYDRPVHVELVRFIEGDHFSGPVGARGGWFTTFDLHLRVSGQWVPAAATLSEPLDPARPFQVIDLRLPAPVWATGVRLSGPSGGLDGFVTCAEVDAVAPYTEPLRVNANGRR